MLFHHIMRDIEIKRRDLRRETRICSDDNACHQADAALGRALRRLPSVPTRSWAQLSVSLDLRSGRIRVYTNVTPEASGCTYDWIIDNCPSVYFKHQMNKWVVTGTVEEETQLAIAIVEVSAPAPSGIIDLIMSMGYIRQTSTRTVGGELTFSCHLR